MFSGIKDADQYIRFFFLTGLTKILKMNIFSALNNLKDISYSYHYYDLMGFTWEEIEKNFRQEIEELARINNLTIEETKEKIKKYYNGYNFGNKKDTIYNPRNINNLFFDVSFEFFWSNTGIPSAMVEYIKAKNINVQEIVDKIGKGELAVREIDLKIEHLDRIKPEVFLLNSGYLTVKDYVNNVYYLDYPNLETKYVVSDFFAQLSIGDYDFSKILKINKLIESGLRNK